MIAYLNGQYLEKESIKISPDDRGFLFADGLYEVVRFYNGRPFRLEEHRHRLENGARALRFSRDTFEDFTEVVQTITAKNNLTEADSSIVYFQITRGAAPRSHSFPSNDTPLTVYAFAREFHSHDDEQKNGAKAITVPDDRWANCNLKTIALLPNTMAHQLARDNKAIEALFIRDNFVQEGSHSNVMIVQGGTVATPPLSSFILPGITRSVVLRMCQQLSVPAVEKNILKEDLQRADEVFIVGTTLEITPIVQVDDHVIVNHQSGPLCRKLQEAFWRIITK